MLFSNAPAKHTGKVSQKHLLPRNCPCGQHVLERVFCSLLPAQQWPRHGSKQEKAFVVPAFPPPLRCQHQGVRNRWRFSFQAGSSAAMSRGESWLTATPR